MKSNGHGTLENQIASTLNSAEVDKAALVSLLEEAHAALVMVQNVIEAETPRLHDLSNTDPDASLDLINRSKLRAERLEKAITKLLDRISAIELYEFQQRYHAKADTLRAERGLLAGELAGTYEPFLIHLTKLYARIDANAGAISALHASAPQSESRPLLDAELTARGLQSYDAAHPRLRDSLKIPEFIKSNTIAFSPDPMQIWNQYAARSHAAMAQRMAEKGALATGPDWAAGRDLQAAHEETEHARRADELRAKEIADRAAFERRLQDDDRRRRLGS